MGKLPDNPLESFKKRNQHLYGNPNNYPFDCPLQNPVAQCDQAPALGAASGRKEEGLPRIIVRFVGCRTRPLDPDNFAGSVKDLLDGLRHSGLIPGDDPWCIILETEQVKVTHRNEEYTEITITYQ